MKEKDLKYFKKLLKEQLEDLLKHGEDAVSGMRDPGDNLPDPTDRASFDADRSFMLRIRDREAKLINKIREALDRIEGYIERAGKAGGKILLDGRGATVAGKESGFWLGPTVIDEGTADSEWVKDEIFGPVLSVVRVPTLEKAIEVEASSPFGNAAAIYTTRGAVARTFALRASSAMIGVNIGVPVPREPFSFGGWNSSRFGNGDAQVTAERGVNQFAVTVSQ